MAYIENLHTLKIFRKSDITALTGNENVAKELLRQYKKRGLISQIRRDIYVANDLANKAIVANKFEIGSNINSSAYLSHHAALEYYGLANQVFYAICVSSKESFKLFNYEGITYIFCRSKSDLGISKPPYDSMIWVTDIERTVVDCLNRIDLAGGLEELVACFSLITLVNEQKMQRYLDDFGKQVLYQKAGFVLGYFRKEMKLSDEFFEYCRAKTGKSTRYLTYNQESNAYFKEWLLVAPENILSYLEQGSNNELY
jgi:predicted transcriptional regulator of viral defense system